MRSASENFHERLHRILFILKDLQKCFKKSLTKVKCDGNIKQVKNSNQYCFKQKILTRKAKNINDHISIRRTRNMKKWICTYADMYTRRTATRELSTVWMYQQINSKSR